ncbi:hypothetical protein PV703_27145 [Streptomyces sp. ME01-24h]|nr:hypothetical protein [Streptomyces sp. ME19-03-3]MDX3215475.1 hypothetical protein [Streptomyces sp. ME02-6991-2B]MDX3356914.1 hypothetical protein [Streptomyces sp. ME01-24h]
MPAGRNEYALYLGAPAEDWAATSAAFQVMLETRRRQAPGN